MAALGKGTKRESFSSAAEFGPSPWGEGDRFICDE
jgi:hypothetical protein